jgi:hypothetical protein
LPTAWLREHRRERPYRRDVPLIAGLAILWFTVIAWATRDQRDAANDGRSIDRYSHAMRVLSRRGPAKPATTSSSGGRYVVLPPAPPEPVPADRKPVARKGIVERRRAMLRRLAIASAVSFAGILLGGPWLVIHLCVDAVLVGYVVTLRRIALRTADAQRRERRAALAAREAAHRAAYEAARASDEAAGATVHALPERALAVND